MALTFDTDQVTLWTCPSTLVMPHLREGLIAKGFTPSELDPQLYFGHVIVVLTYVDACMFFGQHLKKIDENHCQVEAKV